MFKNQQGINGAEALDADVLKEAIFVDVRTPGEFAEQSIPGSINIPLQTIGNQLEATGLKPSDTIVLYCKSGMRSAKALSLFKSMGMENIQNLGSFESALEAYNLRSSAQVEQEDTETR